MLLVVFPAAADAAVHTQLVRNFPDTPIQVFAPRSVPGSTLYVVQKGGKIIRRQSGGHRNVVLDIQKGLDGRRARPSPALISGRKLFVYYTNQDWDSRVVRYTLNSGLGHVMSGSRRTILARTSRPATTTAARCSTAAAISTSASATEGRLRHMPQRPGHELEARQAAPP